MRESEKRRSLRLGEAVLASVVAALLFAPSGGAQGEEAGLLETPSQAIRIPDGKILDERIVTLSEEAMAILRKSARSADELLQEVDLRAITYGSDGLRVHGYLAMPKKKADEASEKLPCIIFNRGGYGEFGSFTDRRAQAFLGRLARWGYVAIASQYRGTGGEEGRDEFGGAEIADVLNLIPVLESVPQADAARIGMFGWSRGGLMTYLALTHTDRIRAAVIGAGVTDSFDLLQRRPEMEEGVYNRLVDWMENQESALEARSPLRWHQKLNKTTPILLLHGSADWRVHPGQSLSMASALLESLHPFRLVLLEGGDHSLAGHRKEVDRQLREWMDRFVRDQESWPNLAPPRR